MMVGKAHLKSSMTLGLLCCVFLLGSQNIRAGEAQSWKAEDWYTPEKYPDAPFIRKGTNNQSPIKNKTLRVKRPLLIVRDLARSLDFYLDVLGLELYSVEPYYNRDPKSLGYQMFNIPPGSRKRMAMLNTSDEVRGLTLQEVRDFEFTFDQKPRAFTILFETDDLLGIRERAARVGIPVIEPLIYEIPATQEAPRLRFAEFALIDPDNHVVAFFQYFDSDEEWTNAQHAFKDLLKSR